MGYMAASVGVNVHPSSHWQSHGCPGAVQNWPCPLPAAALWISSPVPSLGNTVELELVRRVWVSQFEGKSIGELAPQSSAMQQRGYKYDSPTLLPPIVVGELVLLA